MRFHGSKLCELLTLYCFNIRYILQYSESVDLYLLCFNLFTFFNDVTSIFYSVFMSTHARRTLTTETRDHPHPESALVLFASL